MPDIPRLSPMLQQTINKLYIKGLESKIEQFEYPKFESDMIMLIETDPDYNDKKTAFNQIVVYRIGRQTSDLEEILFSKYVEKFSIQFDYELDYGIQLWIQNVQSFRPSR